jgi:hypothetical protein
MPTASQYARYRQDRTTIWVSKAAHVFLSRERDRPEEGVGVVLDRLLKELRQLRRAGGGTAAAATEARPKARAGAPRGGARGGGRKAASTSRPAAKRGRSRA